MIFAHCCRNNKSKFETDTNEMKFTPIDPKTWKRAELFGYFSQMAPTGYSMTVELDITKLLNTLKAAKCKFFPAYLWLVTKALNRQEEFKIAIKDGQLGYYETLTPLYATFHEDDKTFSFMWTSFSEDFTEFYQAYLENQRLYGDNHGVLAQKGLLPPENAYTVSCLPWVSFKSFSVHSYENKPYYFPSVEAGKYYESAGKILLPLSITCHHATTDGYHVARFLESLQKDMDNFETFLEKI